MQRSHNPDKQTINNQTKQKQTQTKQTQKARKHSNNQNNP